MRQETIFYTLTIATNNFYSIYKSYWKCVLCIWTIKSAWF